MSIVKVIEVIASSEKSIEDALQQAVAEASKTIRNIDSVYVKDIKAHVKDGKITSYGLISKISFRLDENGKEDQTAQQAQAEVTPKVPRQDSPEQTTSETQPEANATSEQEEEQQPAHEKDFVPAH